MGAPKDLSHGMNIAWYFCSSISTSSPATFNKGPKSIGGIFEVNHDRTHMQSNYDCSQLYATVYTCYICNRVYVLRMQQCIRVTYATVYTCYVCNSVYMLSMQPCIHVTYATVCTCYIHAYSNICHCCGLYATLCTGRY